MQLSKQCCHGLRKSHHRTLGHAAWNTPETQTGLAQALLTVSTIPVEKRSGGQPAGGEVACRCTVKGASVSPDFQSLAWPSLRR